MRRVRRPPLVPSLRGPLPWSRFHSTHTTLSFLSLPHPPARSHGTWALSLASPSSSPLVAPSHALGSLSQRPYTTPSAPPDDTHAQASFEQAQSQRAAAGHHTPATLALLHRSADAGHPPAAHELGLLFLHGSEHPPITPDPARALAHFLQAGRGGLPRAQYNAGLMYATGRATGQPDPEQAAHWYAQAADQDYGPAQCNLGLLYLDGYFASASRTGAPGAMRASERLSQAVRMLMLAGEQGNAVALFNLALLYRHVFHEPEQAVRYLTQAAEAGSSHAQYNLAQLYWTGQEVAQDHARAEVYARQAGDVGGLGKAQTLLGLICWQREAWVEARAWWEKAAQQGEGEAHYHLSQWMRVHEGSSPTPTPTPSPHAPYSPTAYKHLLQAAQAGHAPAQFTLGLAQQQQRVPTGEAPTPAHALEWIQEAAQQGLREAQAYLGGLYLYGEGGVDAQPEQAAHWYQQAAEQGSAEAMVQLGLLKAHSHPEESRTWLLQAAEQGDAQAQVNLGLLAWQQQKESVQPSPPEWFALAAAQQHADAFYYLALWARSGKRLPSPPPGLPPQKEGEEEREGEEMVRLYLEKAAELGHAKAAYRLGEWYLTGGGRGGRAERTKALEYFSRAADLGDSVAQTVLGAMSASSTSQASPPPKKKRDRALARRKRMEAMAAARSSSPSSPSSSSSSSSPSSKE